MWSELDPDPSAKIERYVETWIRPPGGPTRAVPSFGATPSNAIELLRAPPGSWNEYLTALRACDAYWTKRQDRFSVLGPEWSWVNTIATGGDLLRREDWHAFSAAEINILLAFRQGEDDWGLLGSMRGAATAVGAFLRNRDGIRYKVRRALQPVLSADGEDAFVDAAVAAIEAISELEGFGPGIATRLIALARPDRGVSVNNGSAPGLGTVAGLARTRDALANARNFPRLLRWVYQQPWYSVPEPSDSFERTIWCMRAALIDSFVYKPV